MSNTVLENFFCSSISGDAFSLFIESFIINNIYHLITRLTNNKFMFTSATIPGLFPVQCVGTETKRGGYMWIGLAH